VDTGLGLMMLKHF